MIPTYTIPTLRESCFLQTLSVIIVVHAKSTAAIMHRISPFPMELIPPLRAIMPIPAKVTNVLAQPHTFEYALQHFRQLYRIHHGRSGPRSGLHQCDHRRIVRICRTLSAARPASKCRDRDRCTAAGLDVTHRAPFHRTRAQIYRKLRRSIQISFRAVTCKPAVIRAPLHAEKAHTRDAVSLHDFLFCYA